MLISNWVPTRDGVAAGSGVVGALTEGVNGELGLPEEGLTKSMREIIFSATVLWW